LESVLALALEPFFAFCCITEALRKFSKKRF
jgi:hypothetical protein